MGDVKQDKEKVLNSFELGNELSALVAKAVIPSFVADKIKEKLEGEVEPTLSQLYELVDIIKKKVKTRQYSKHVPRFKEKEETSGFTGSVEDEEVDVERIFKTIEGLSSRIKKIEEIPIKKYGESADRIVTTDDIVIPEKITVPRQGGKVYPLGEIPSDPENVVVLMKWLQYLVDKVGKANLSDVLEYYVDIGWLSDNIITNLIEYSEGITEERKKEEGVEKKLKLSDLQAKDHIQSLLFIQRLKGEQPDGHFLSRIERELSKMTKNLGSI